MFYFRTHGEIDYLDVLNGVPSSTIDEWSGMDFVARDARVWPKAQLHVDVRYIRKSSGFWDGFNEERRWRSRRVLSIPSHALRVFRVRDSFI